MIGFGMEQGSFAPRRGGERREGFDLELISEGADAANALFEKRGVKIYARRWQCQSPVRSMRCIQAQSWNGSFLHRGEVVFGLDLGSENAGGVQNFGKAMC